jgi:hypothetical protein
MAAVTALQCGPALIRADFALNGPTRLQLSPFCCSAFSEDVVLTVELSKEKLGGVPFDGNLGPGEFVFNGRRLVVHAPEGEFRIEAILRLAWAIVTHRLGGVLLHAGAVAVDGRAAIVTGKSGTGKTTLTRHARGAGALLLSDEMVQWFGGGEGSKSIAYGTPFFSDAACAGAPISAEVDAVLTVVHGETEHWSLWAPEQASRTVMSQAFRAPADVAPVRATTVLPMLSKARLRVLTCRNHPLAGVTLVDSLQRHDSAE